MHAIVSFAKRYYTQELHDAMLPIYEKCSFANYGYRSTSTLTRDYVLADFGEIHDIEHMMEFEFTDFSNFDNVIIKILIDAKVPFERLYYPFDGYDGTREMFYPDGTSYSEIIDEGGNPVIPIKAFDPLIIQPDEITPEKIFGIIDQYTLRFRNGADYYIDQDYVFIELAKRNSIENVLEQFDKKEISQEEAFKLITEIKAEGLKV